MLLRVEVTERGERNWDLVGEREGGSLSGRKRVRVELGDGSDFGQRKILLVVTVRNKREMFSESVSVSVLCLQKNYGKLINSLFFII